MTRSTVHQITSTACGFTTFMLGLSEKLTRENREPTEREAADISMQAQALGIAVRKGSVTEPAVTDFSGLQL